MTLNTLILLAILALALFAGYFPFWLRKKHGDVDSSKLDFPIGESLAAGIFLGAGLIHMLCDANQGFLAAGVRYPFAFLLAGGVFLSLLWLEHLGKELNHQGSAKSIVILAAAMLSIHSLFEGTALGMSQNILTSMVLALAIFAHKWAASFALSLQINKSPLAFSWRLILFLTFVLMTPLGILGGEMMNTLMGNKGILSPIFNALAAGTFLYIGTLHGLNRSTLIQRCCNIREFSFVVLGFCLMALVAIFE